MSDATGLLTKEPQWSPFYATYFVPPDTLPRTRTTQLMFSVQDWKSIASLVGMTKGSNRYYLSIILSPTEDPE